MKLPSTKIIIALSAAVAIGAAAGSGLTYYLMKNDGLNNYSYNNSSSAPPPTSLKPDKSKENTEVPVATIAHNFDKYLGLKVIAKGKIAKTSGNPPYILVSEDNKSSLVVDASALKVKLDNYQGRQVKLTGTVKFIDIGNQHFSLGIKASSLDAK